MDVRRRKRDQIENFDCNNVNITEHIFHKVENDLSIETTNKEVKKRKADKIATNNIINNKNEEISHNESLKNEQREQLINNTSTVGLKVHFEIDLVAVILLISGLVTRLYHLEEPRNIVFDELHYGKYVSLYMKKIFFFDSHPPLGKQLISAAAYLANFDGQFKFDRIGNPYAEKVPLFFLRLIPALCGSFLIPTAYYLSKEFGFRHWSCIITGLMLLFDNALLTQSRFILMESILIQFLLMGLLCVMKFRKVHDQPFTFAWWIWLTLAAINLTCALCVKYVGFYSLLLALVLIGRDYWNLLSKKEISNLMLWIQLFLRIVILFSIMATVYLGIFYVHLSVLTKAGPHDAVMTSAFQASLEGGLASITKGQPLEVTHGSQITLRHTYGRACWLHSHNEVYPLRYPDKRGSSHQQQVTCYSFKDVNNWWIVKRPEINDLVVTKPSEPIRHGEMIQIVHGITSRALNSHDIAAPMTPQSQEVSCYIDYNISMPAQNLWRVEIANRDQAGNVWHAIQSQVRLIHVNTECALKFSGRMLPEWGFNQHEVVADRIIEQSNAIWNVEEHRYTKSEDQKQRERELINAQMIPLKATSLSFWEKFVELQMKMLFDTHEVQNSHMYSSGPLEWPFLTRGIAYWVSTKSNAQIYLLGNIAVWYTGTIAVIVYSGLLVFYLMRRRRLCYDISEEEWNKFATIGQVLLTGYILNYLPFLFVERTLFLHHYLPAFIYKTLLTVGTIDHIYSLLRIHLKRKHFLSIFMLTIIFWIGFIVFVFRKFACLSYGTAPLSAEEILKLRWSETWDFIIHKT